jgi:predicted transcriptional regulator YdeE
MLIPSFVTRLLAHEIRGTEPRIVELPEPLFVVGLSMETSVSQVRRDVPTLADQYRRFKLEHEVLNRRHPWAFVAVSKDFDPSTGSFWYMVGDVVTGFDAVPRELEVFEIPAIKYAVFPVRPRNRFGWPIAIAGAKRYAFTEWLPDSGYEPAGVIDDFEYHDERSTRKRNPQIDLYVAINDK